MHGREIELNSFTQEYFVLCLVQIGPAVLDNKIFKIVNIFSLRC